MTRNFTLTDPHDSQKENYKMLSDGDIWMWKVQRWKPRRRDPTLYHMSH